MTGGQTVAPGAIWFFVALALLSVLSLGSLNAAVKLEIRLAEEKPATTLVEAAVAHSDKKVYLHQDTLITNENVIDARPMADRTDFNVAIFFTQEEAAEITNATEVHVGKPVAILVNGTVVAAAILRGVVSQRALIIGGFTKEQADEVSSALTVK